MTLTLEVTQKTTFTGWGGDLMNRIDLRPAWMPETSKMRHHLYVKPEDPLAGLRVGQLLTWTWDADEPPTTK